MFTVPYRWDVFPRAAQSHFDQFPDISRLVVQLLYNRGIYDPEDVYTFWSGAYAVNDPFLLPDMDVAVTELMAAIASGAPMAVYGDYDADGVTSTALMSQALKACGANVSVYIPNRFNEGYGLNKSAIATLAEQGIQLIITVDCGIRSVAEVAYGNELGLTFIITDHHLLPQDDTGNDILAPAAAVINPKRQDSQYPFRDFAGVGVAFKVAQALKRRLQQSGLPVDLVENTLLDLVAVGTVADMVPLKRENRTLVQQGLKMLKTPARPGIRALLASAGGKQTSVNAETIGFVLGPRLNAAGRLEDGMLAYRLLSTTDEGEARSLALHLNEINVRRQTLTREFTDKSLASIATDDTASPDSLYLVSDESFNAGVVGLVASRLAELCYRPVLVAQRGETMSHGSARSIPEFHITHALDQCADLLVKYGGHAAAAGFTVENEKLSALEERLQTIARQSLAQIELQKSLPVDAELNLRGVSRAYVEDIYRLSPFGTGNPSPLFCSRDLYVKHYGLVGKDKSHLKLTLSDGKNTWDAIGFKMGKQWVAYPSIPTRIDAVYALEFNTWNGRTRLQLNLKDIRPAD